MDKISAPTAFKTMGLAYCHTTAATSAAAYGKFPQQCMCCNEWMPVGGLRVLRYRKKTNHVPKAYCVECAVAQGFVRWEPGKDPRIATTPSKPWAGAGVKPVKMQRFGTKWEAA